MVPFASYVSRGQSKPRLIFSGINGPIVSVCLLIDDNNKPTSMHEIAVWIKANSL